QYYLSTSSTALSGGSWTNYTPGSAITIGSGKTGTFYLFIKTVKDNAGNTSSGNQTISGTSYHRFGSYVLDNTAPTCNISVSGNKNSDGSYSDSATITLSGTDQGSGISSSGYGLTTNGIKEYNGKTTATQGLTEGIIY